ncbi:MAG: Na+/H+ antiporter subunit E [Rickettsiaceae bacterium]|nr:Na+/H+ antiporter subunit E [Rickettsiaceae bacterium]
MYKPILIRIFYTILSGLFWFCLVGSSGLAHFPFHSCFALIIIFIISANITDNYLLNPYKIFTYYIWLMNEVSSSSLAVSKIIWSLEETNSEIFILNTPFLSDNTKIALYAHSITLTPGTIAIETSGGKILVHSLSKNFTEDLLSQAMENKISLL